jgi:hypothetical protein
VAVVGRLVQKKKKNSTKGKTKRKTIKHNRKTQNGQNGKQTYKTRKQT